MRRTLTALNKAATVYYWTVRWLFWVALLSAVELGVAVELTPFTGLPINNFFDGLVVTTSVSVLIGTAGLSLGLKRCVQMLRAWVLVLVVVYALLAGAPEITVS